NPAQLMAQRNLAAGPPSPPRRPPPVPQRPNHPMSDPPTVQEPTAVTAVMENNGAGAALALDELEDWRRVYDEFLGVKRQCGESRESLTFEKFKGTLQRNKDALVSRHNCTRVKFTVYVKDGKAALKASPVK